MFTHQTTMSHQNEEFDDTESSHFNGTKSGLQHGKHTRLITVLVALGYLVFGGPYIDSCIQYKHLKSEGRTRRPNGFPRKFLTAFEQTLTEDVISLGKFYHAS
jgi:hypothetical protein